MQCDVIYRKILDILKFSPSQQGCHTSGKSQGKGFFFKVSEMSGNFEICQGKIEFWKMSGKTDLCQGQLHMSGNFEICQGKIEFWKMSGKTDLCQGQLHNWFRLNSTVELSWLMCHGLMRQRKDKEKHRELENRTRVVSLKLFLTRIFYKLKNVILKL